MRVNKRGNSKPAGRTVKRATGGALLRRLTLQTPTAAPLYRTVQHKMLQRLAAGDWKPGDRLPNEPELAEHFGVASLTLRAAIADLVSAGLLHRRPGRGTYVARHEAYGQQQRFSNMCNADKSKLVVTREIVSLRHKAATPECVQLLKLGRDARPRVCEVECLLRAAGEPVAATTIVLPLPLFAALREEDLAASDENLYSVYQRQCGITVLRMEERISARCADAGWARKLGVKIGHPLLCVERIGYTYNNVPVEIRYRTYEGMKHHYLFTHDNL